MCGGGGLGSLFSGGSLGGILGSLGGGLLDIVAPEIGIPLALATGGGGALGSFLGNVASGKSPGASILPALETGGISGALAGVGNLAAGGDFFGAPASSLSGIFGGAAPTDAASAAVGTTTAPATQLASAAPTIGGTTTASAAGAPAAGGAGGAITDIPATIGPATGASPATLGGSAVGAGGQPWGTGFANQLWGGGLTGGGETAANTVPLGTPLTAENAAAAGATPTAGSGSSGNIFSNIWSKLAGGGGTNAATIADLTQGGAPLAPNISSSNLAALSALNPGDPGLAAATATGSAGAGGGSMLSRGLVGEPGSILSDLTKPTTLLTGGAALLPLLQGNTIPGLAGYQNQATAFNTQGTPLAQSLTTGQLPPGAQSSLDAATRAAKAAVRSQYAAMGISGGSQEADALANVDAREATQKVAMLEDLTKIGVGEMAQATPILQNVMQQRLLQDQQQQQAIARLAAALAGSVGTEKTTA